MQRHYRSYQARKAVKGKRLQIFLGLGVGSGWRCPQSEHGWQNSRRHILFCFLLDSRGNLQDQLQVQLVFNSNLHMWALHSPPKLWKSVCSLLNYCSTCLIFVPRSTCLHAQLFLKLVFNFSISWFFQNQVSFDIKFHVSRLFRLPEIFCFQSRRIQDAVIQASVCLWIRLYSLFRKTSAGDLAGTMSNRERAAKLFLQFSGGKNHWTADDMSDFCSAIWKQDGFLAAVTSGIFIRDLCLVGKARVYPLCYTSGVDSICDMSDTCNVNSDLVIPYFKCCMSHFNSTTALCIPAWEAASLCRLHHSTSELRSFY